MEQAYRTHGAHGTHPTLDEELRRVIKAVCSLWGVGTPCHPKSGTKTVEETVIKHLLGSFLRLRNQYVSSSKLIRGVLIP